MKIVSVNKHYAMKTYGEVEVHVVLLEINMGKTFVLRSIMHVIIRVPNNLAQTAVFLNCVLDMPVVI
jgi:hypothetical protein